MNEFAIAAIGEDRPGIVAALTSALNDIDASMEDSSMTILGGHFAMLLLVAFDGDSQALESSLASVAKECELMLEVRKTSHHESGEARKDLVVAAYGPDKPGLVAKLSQVLAESGANISDFGSRLGESGLFAMWFNVDVADAIDAGDLEAALRGAGGEVALEVSVHAADAEAL